MLNTLDIFYKEIISSASKGKIVIKDEYYNIIFNTIIPKYNINLISDYNNDNVFVPTLYINNKKLFDELLVKYVDLSIDFYKESNKRKILTLLWANATLDDFLNPIKFLNNRINFIKNSNKLEINSYYSNILNSNISIKNTKCGIYSETPSCLSISLNNETEYYELPRLYYGISNDTVYIYAIQNSKNNNLVIDKYKKDMKRKLYSINEGLDVKEDTYENYGVGNLKDVTPSFLLCSIIGTMVFNNNNISNISIPSFLIGRWNSKEIAYDNKEKCLMSDNSNIDEVENDRVKHNYIQENLTEKLIRTFRRIDFHIDGINITNYPENALDSLKLNINKDLSCNNNLLISEICNIMNKNNYKKMR